MAKVYETPLHEFATPCYCKNVMGNCSACMFRNRPLFCEKLDCDGVDSGTGLQEPVYWVPKNGFGIHPKLETWLSSTPTEQVRQISKSIVATMAYKAR